MASVGFVCTGLDFCTGYRLRVHVQGDERKRREREGERRREREICNSLSLPQHVINTCSAQTPEERPGLRLSTLVPKYPTSVPSIWYHNPGTNISDVSTSHVVPQYPIA
eukprot:1252900-Rhodomonas_salina.2